MAGLVLKQVNSVVEHYVARNAEALIRLRDEDEEIDIQYTSVFRELLTYMMEDPRNITACTHLLFCAKNIERIGDHATNIAEHVYFLVHGTLPEDNRPKDDQSSYTVIGGED
jgi:phosphate transport system protein